jgi:hypothetical protein
MVMMIMTMTASDDHDDDQYVRLSSHLSPEFGVFPHVWQRLCRLLLAPLGYELREADWAVLAVHRAAIGAGGDITAVN